MCAEYIEHIYGGWKCIFLTMHSIKLGGKVDAALEFQIRSRSFAPESISLFVDNWVARIETPIMSNNEAHRFDRGVRTSRLVGINPAAYPAINFFCALSRGFNVPPPRLSLYLSGPHFYLVLFFNCVQAGGSKKSECLPDDRLRKAYSTM